MRLSIVIPCYNMEVYLPPCLDSLVHQDIHSTDLEVIIVNDGSKDDTLTIASEYAKKYSQILVIDKINKGVGAARNTGLDHATGTYIYFLDPDDYLANNCLKPLLEQIEAHHLDILTFKSIPVTTDKYLLEVPLPAKNNMIVRDGIGYLAHKKYQNEIWWYFIRTEFLRQTNIGFIEGRWMEDAIFTAQLFCAAKRMAHLEWNIHRYRILPHSAMRNKSPEHYNKVIFDNANAAEVFEGLIAFVDKEHPERENAIKRLRTRQQSFVFFILVRLMKSDLPLSEIKPLLEKFKAVGAYPLNSFLGKDYNGLVYKVFVSIFNKPKLILPFMRIFRTVTLSFK
jgi:glycosyltransferase involved in cell wall biosynthesis